MNKKQLKILYLIKDKLNIRCVDNPCNVKGLAKYHNNTTKVLKNVVSILDEFVCTDIPSERLDEIIKELKED